MSKQAYIYALKDPRTNEVRYIGITTNPKQRYIAHCSHHTRADAKGKWIKELKSANMKPKMEILEDCDLEDGFQREHEVILEYVRVGANLLQETIIPPREQPTIKRMFSVSEEIANALDEYVAEQKSQQRNINASEVARQALYDFLEGEGRPLERPLIVWGRQKRE